MQVRQLQSGEIREIYERYIQEAFPPAERKPFWKIQDAIRQGRYICYGLFEQETLLSYAFFMKEKGVGGGLLLDYFTSLPQYRNQGYGSIFLQKLNEVCEGKTVFAEVEAPEDARASERELCKRRIAFYQRNGCIDTTIYCKFYKVQYKILLKASEVISVPSIGELICFYERIYHRKFSRNKLRFWKQRKRRMSRFKNV